MEPTPFSVLQAVLVDRLEALSTSLPSGGVIQFEDERQSFVVRLAGPSTHVFDGGALSPDALVDLSEGRAAALLDQKSPSIPVFGDAALVRRILEPFEKQRPGTWLELRTRR